MPRFIDITGQRFGRLVVLRLHRRGSSGIHSRWSCLCDCGRARIASGRSLRIGRTTSCGCGRIAHGQWGSPTYKSWHMMIQRCSNSKYDKWAYYGGRGISVCERWKNFQNFLTDMGERPIGTSLDRYPNNNGNYELTNCRWATPKQQQNNLRSNRRDAHEPDEK